MLESQVCNPATWNETQPEAMKYCDLMQSWNLLSFIWQLCLTENVGDDWKFQWWLTWFVIGYALWFLRKGFFCVFRVEIFCEDASESNKWLLACACSAWNFVSCHFVKFFFLLLAAIKLLIIFFASIKSLIDCTWRKSHKFISGFWCLLVYSSVVS